MARHIVLWSIGIKEFFAMRLALLIVGALRTFPCHLNHFFERFAALGWDVDYYFCISRGGASTNSKGMSYSACHIENITHSILATYDPIETLDVSVKFVVNPNCTVPRLSTKQTMDKSDQHPVERMWETLASAYKCFKRMETYESENLFLYDYVWRLRPDILFYEPLPTKLFNKATFPYGRVRCNSHSKCLNDHIALLPRHAASRYFDGANEYLWCNSTQNDFHAYIGEHYYERFRNMHVIDPLIKYTLVRPDGLECRRAPNKERDSCRKYSQNLSLT